MTSVQIKVDLMDFDILNTVQSDLDFVYWLFDQAAVYQEKNNYPAWRGYDKKILQEDIERRRQYKITHKSKIACIFTVLLADPLIWTDNEKGNAIYLHRIVVNPDFKGNRLFEKILHWAMGYAKARNKEYVRMDTWANNPTIIAYYQSFGFKFLGEITTTDNLDLPHQNRNITLALLEKSMVPTETT
jgi:GNAT superfamily N-acetyltransferase